jgi:hypothetical protein
MTPEERREYIIDLARVRAEAKREAYEDAAKIVEDGMSRAAMLAAIRSRMEDVK